MRHVLVSYAPTANGEQALRAAVAIAGATDAAVTALAIVPPDGSAACCALRGRQWLDLLGGVLRDQLAAAVERLPVGVRPRLEVRCGEEVEVLRAMADELGCDLVVLPAPPRRIAALRRRDPASVLAAAGGVAVAQALRARRLSGDGGSAPRSCATTPM